MSQAGSLSRTLILCTFLQEHDLPAVDQNPPGVTTLLQYYDPNPYPYPQGDVPHEMAMRLAFIGDEMEARWTLPRIAELPWMAMHSLATIYNQAGLRGVLRSFMDGLTNLRGNRRFWSVRTLRDRGSPNGGRKLSVLLLALLLDWGLHFLQ
ncbi:bcl-2-interacting killer [Rhinolophus ferrumequinum]|nr:bcl-2-interacting killer [Rhinolophus ferrumequinum]